jgi:hypothetical protein
MKTGRKSGLIKFQVNASVIDSSHQAHLVIENQIISMKGDDYT